MARKKTGTKSVSSRFTAKPLRPPQTYDTITIKSHRELFAKSKEIARRVEGDPEFSVMFLSNPVLALESYGIKLSRELQHHVLNTLRHPPKLRIRREELEAKLEEALGEPARPTEPKWMAGLVLKTQKIAPRTIGRREPAYKPPLNAEAIARLQAARPKGGKRYATERRIGVKFTLQVALPKSALRRMDLDAELPKLKRAAKAPARLTLEQAWFYKDDPLVRDAVELGQIMRRGFPFRTPAEFRDIAEGKKVDAFRRFVGGVRLKEVPRK